MPTPRNPTVDIIIEPELSSSAERIHRLWALPGGFVDYGESLETAAVREALEETTLQVQLVELFHVYSDPNRDPRQHTLSTVFIATAIIIELESGGIILIRAKESTAWLGAARWIC